MRNEFAELVIINTPLPDEFGQELAEMIAETTSAGIILICGGDAADEIADRVSDSGVNVTVRRRLGSDVDASCGQLRRKMQRSGSPN